jgi:anaerobic ribonucleoside-triphosphate reductase activating protein
MNPQQLADILTSHPDVTGVTLSGGEPFQQAGLLAETLTLIKSKKPLNVIAFTGYRYEKLLRMDDHFGIHQLLAEVDVLIDGGYIHALNDNQGLRGSSNQRIIHLTNSLKGLDLENQPRSIELHVEDGHVLAVGVPDIQMLHSLDMIFQATQDRS